ncbi:ecto-ADP-ribosyltransferase 5-like isoform X2 [Thunnus thynnus]|uniref:ecto-ADP-ribosyltransferase 5-like isoform X2 n=1 Tax=Thunnus thynnus TaxID=8237 RepID=UPI003528D17A
MKAHLLIFAAVLLVPCWTMPAGQPNRGASAPQPGASAPQPGASAPQNSSSIPLNMVPESVDDMYHNCTEEMEKKVKEEYFNKENVGKVAEAWEDEQVKQCVDDGKKQVNNVLSEDHIQAICVYTSNRIYDQFNKAVRTSRSIYSSSSYQFHSLHFWLTTAIQTLNKKCHTTYRRTTAVFNGNVSDIIRFGTFASSSFRTNLTYFGNETCFEIKTCSGASVKPYSVYPNEEEVLIPPYETFNITKTVEGRSQFKDLNDCNRVFILESAGGKSELNCKAAGLKESKPYSYPLTEKMQ